MPYKTGSIKAIVSLIGALILYPAFAAGQCDLQPLAPPEEYGNLLISRTSRSNGMEPVTFSHWLHRVKYTCRVCHSELGFSMQTNATEITEEANRKGKFCGACHNGVIVFGHTESNCMRCHNNDRGFGSDKFSLLSSLPKATFGNGKDWTRALEKGLIHPARYLAIKPSDDISFDKDLVLDAEWANIFPVIFSHKRHTAWLDCSNCHPDIFNVKKKTTEHFAMKYILDNQFCGVCHLRVAFPLQDCKRCHQKSRR